MDTENPEVAPGPAVGAPAERSAGSRNARSIRSRWLVHLGLLTFIAASLGTLQLLHIRNAIHADVGLAFAGLVVVHLAQRRHRITPDVRTAHAISTTDRARVTSLGVRCDPRRRHDQRRGFRDPRLGPGCPTAPTPPTAFRQVALALLSRAGRVPDRPCLAAVETNPTVHDPIARTGGGRGAPGRIRTCVEGIRSPSPDPLGHGGGVGSVSHERAWNLVPICHTDSLGGRSSGG